MLDGGFVLGHQCVGHWNGYTNVSLLGNCIRDGGVRMNNGRYWTLGKQCR